MVEKNKLIGVMSVVLLCAVFIVSTLFSACDDSDNDGGDKGNGVQNSGNQAGNDSADETDSYDYTVVLDAGHGGIDPGKVGVDGSLEKDINLQIVLKLKEILENDEEINNGVNIKVVLTRTDDNGHYTESDSNKKMADMKARCNIVEDANADILVSIHQNSYHSASVNGAQVFYYEKSEKGQTLASVIQKKLVAKLEEDGKGRVEKSNDNYYILLNVSCPAVIVECGFLSNPEEAAKLGSEEYQEKVAKAVAEGIMEYLTSGGENKE